MFYFTLGNFRPKQRSKLSSIFLVAIVKHKILNNYGMDAVIRPFVDDVKKLVSYHQKATNIGSLQHVLICLRKMAIASLWMEYHKYGLEQWQLCLQIILPVLPFEDLRKAVLHTGCVGNV